MYSVYEFRPSLLLLQLSRPCCLLMQAARVVNMAKGVSMIADTRIACTFIIGADSICCLGLNEVIFFKRSVPACCCS